MTDKAPEYPINQTLIEEATHAREEWRVIKDRLAKVEEHKDKVSGDVYERVKGDYAERLKSAHEIIQKKKEQIGKELHTLEGTRKKITAQLDEHKKRLEEIKFRNTLGEFSEEDYQASARAEQDKIGKFETVINAIDNNIARYSQIFEEDTDVFAAPVEGGGTAEVEEEAAPHEKIPKTDESGYIIEEEGNEFFGKDEREFERTSPDIEMEESATSKAPPDLGASREVTAAGKQARVAIIAGDSAGAAYPLRGTVTIGRAETNTIAIKDSKVSRQHAQIQQHGNEYAITDLNSSNGTFVNGERIEEHVLADGDEIQVGDTVMQFEA